MRANDPIDMLRFFKKVWNGKNLILKSITISFIIGCIYSLLSPVTYQSHTTFVPQTSDQNSSAQKGLGSLASLAGINLNAEVASSLDNYISPLLYSKIIESDEFSVEMVNEKLIFLNGDESTIKDYLTGGENGKDLSIYNSVKDFFIKSFKKDSDIATPESILNQYNFISKKDFELINTFQKKFSIETNEKEGYIKVKATDKNPFISTQIVKLVTKNLQSRIIALRTSKIKEQLDYSREQYENKRIEFEKLQNKLAVFRDSNKNISSSVFKSELDKIESEYQLQRNILTSLATEYNNNKIKLSKDTPIFSVLDEVSVPNKRFKPKRKIIVLFSIIIGVTGSILFLVFKDPVIDMIDEIFKK